MKTVLWLALAALNLFVRGFLIKVFWVWFIVTQWTSLPALNLLPAIGLSLFVAAITSWDGIKSERELDDIQAGDSAKVSLANQGIYLISYMLMLLIGFVIHSLM